MNEQPPPDHPPATAAPSTPGSVPDQRPAQSDKWEEVAPIMMGFVIGAMLWVPAFSISSQDGLVLLLIVPFGTPVAAGLLASFKATRRFGLGMLLASGLGWLALGALCAGLWK
ncbi:MAG: hypothetical protein HZA93_20695 [Verrucomicrobia bacterium]|nr:hypothetical protein [Verrucomicrobiota bacterium]